MSFQQHPRKREGSLTDPFDPNFQKELINPVNLCCAELKAFFIVACIELHCLSWVTTLGLNPTRNPSPALRGCVNSASQKIHDLVSTCYKSRDQGQRGTHTRSVEQAQE